MVHTVFVLFLGLRDSDNRFYGVVSEKNCGIIANEAIFAFVSLSRCLLIVVIMENICNNIRLRIRFL